MARGYVTVDSERCKGCELCTSACPQHVLEMDHSRLNRKGYHPVRLVDPKGQCTGCALCAVTCPDIALTVFRLLPMPDPAIVSAGA
jgi:2-oxoglutarate ferredoxin oxidoreductase subunit delta